MRLVTRADADGLCCAVFLQLKEGIDAIEFAHPKDMQDGKVRITPNDIITNLPYHPNCGMWFDHHATSIETAKTKKFKGRFALAPSCARVVYEYYNDPNLRRYEELLINTDKMDSANLTVEDVTNPQGYILLFYTIDPRTGLGPFKEYFMRLLHWIADKPIDEILEIPEVKERCRKLKEEEAKFAEVMKNCSRLEDNVIITDLRELKQTPAGNRFFIYTLFPQGNVQVRVFNGKGGEFVVVALGKSIFNRTCTINLGELCAEYGGGGHEGAATCQLPHDKANEVIAEIIKRLKGK